jgi:hypothetical protein
MIKYILNSGAVKKDPALAKKFFAEIFKGSFPSTPRIEYILFTFGGKY